MAALPYRILERKRAGMRLTEDEIRSVTEGAADGSWSEGQIAAFLMAAAIRGLDEEETRALTLAMMESGERWDLKRDLPFLTDKHSTGGVGDKVSLVLAPLAAACGLQVGMLAGRGLGHTAGTMDKLECIPGIDLDLDRGRFIALVEDCGLAIGGATGGIAPADKRFYAIRDVTATIDSMPLILGSILSKKLAMGAGAVAFDVKTGDGAFIQDLAPTMELARGLASISRALGTAASCLVTDMSQPMGRWIGHAAELSESFEALEGKGAPDLMEVTFGLVQEMGRLIGRPLTKEQLERAIASGAARERFDQWAERQGGDPDWLANPDLTLAPEVKPLRAERTGVLARVETRQLGLLLVEGGGGRKQPGDQVDLGVAIEVLARLGDPVKAGQDLGRAHLRSDEPGLAQRMAACFHVEDEGHAPELIVARVE